MAQPDKHLLVVSITCYFNPDYVRSRTIRTALLDDPSVALVIIKNRHTGLLRFPEVLWKLLVVRIRVRPDAYLLNFRGYELLPFLVLIAGRKPIVFDELVNPVLVVNEHRTQKRGVIKMLMCGWVVLARLYYVLLKRCTVILSDTPAHAAYSAQLAGIDPKRYAAVPVGTDETLFYPQKTAPRPSGIFQVFMYSTGGQPLHGIPIVLEAARLLKKHTDIEFVLSGKGLIAERAAEARKDGAHIKHTEWIPFETLPDIIRSSGICLGGPFGDTVQAQYVITGKTYQFLACAAPVIVGKSETLKLFSDKINSLVVPQADPRALADAILWAKNHPKQLTAIAREGRKLYETQFSQQIIACDVVAIINRLI